MSIFARRVRSAAAGYTAGFRTVGTNILDPSGNVFVPLGVNVAYYRYMTAGYTYSATTSAIGKSSSALEWGWNMIRIPVRLDDDLNVLATLIQEYTSAGIVCVIDCHTLWSLPDGNLGVNCSRIAEFDAFWLAMATTYKANTYVWFNLHNEPPLLNTDWTDLHVRHINSIRGAGARNIIICDGPNNAIDGGPANGAKYSWEPDMFPAAQAAANGNIMLSFHNYGMRTILSDMNHYIDNVFAMNCPLIIGEMGFNTTEEQASSAGAWDSNYLASMVCMDTRTTRGVGLTVWIGNGRLDNLALKSGNVSFWEGGSGNNLAGPGPRLWDLGHGVTTPKTYTWNWFVNPLCIDTQPTLGYAGGWTAAAGYTCTYRTGQSWASYGTTTDASTNTASYLRYYKYGTMQEMPTASFNCSAEINMPAAGSIEVKTFWQNNANQNVGTTVIQTYAVPSGTSTLNFTLTKPVDAATSLFLYLTPVGYAAGLTWAVTNITSNRSEFFHGDSPNTATVKYAWSSGNALSPSAKVS